MITTHARSNSAIHPNPLHYRYIPCHLTSPQATPSPLYRQAGWPSGYPRQLVFGDPLRNCPQVIGSIHGIIGRRFWTKSLDTPQLELKRKSFGVGFPPSLGGCLFCTLLVRGKICASMSRLLMACGVVLVFDVWIRAHTFASLDLGH